MKENNYVLNFLFLLNTKKVVAYGLILYMNKIYEKKQCRIFNSSISKFLKFFVLFYLTGNYKIKTNK